MLIIILIWGTVLQLWAQIQRHGQSYHVRRSFFEGTYYHLDPGHCASVVSSNSEARSISSCMKVSLQRCLLSSWSGALCFSRELKSGGAVNLIMKPGLSVKVLIIILIRGTVLQPWAQIQRRGQSHHESRVMILWLFGTNLKIVQVFRPKTNGDERCDISGENCYAQEQQIMNWYSASFYAL